MSTTLGRIVARTRERVEEKRQAVPLDRVLALAPTPGARRPFSASISRPNAVNVIAEFKRRSPSRGIIREDLHPVYVAQGYDFADIAFVLTTKGVIAIDAGTTEATAREALAALRKVTAQPITHVIITHAHWDHIGGLAVFTGPGVQVIAQSKYPDELRVVNETGVPFRYFFGREAQRRYAFAPDRVVGGRETRDPHRGAGNERLGIDEERAQGLARPNEPAPGARLDHGGGVLESRQGAGLPPEDAAQAGTGQALLGLRDRVAGVAALEHSLAAQRIAGRAAREREARQEGEASDGGGPDHLRRKTTSRSAPSATASSTASASLRKVTTSAPSCSNRWTRL